VPRQVTDAAERLEALDPLRSFCVTAPAGSGKTELLIQRYLTLLARVEQPQEVLAITFTRKAAAEMRSRISEALASAAAETEPAGDHAAHTWSLARQVLAVDARRNWQLRLNPTQMNIKTIDSFCGTLTRQMPVLSRFGGPIAAVDDAYPYYREATRMLLDDLEEGGAAAADLAELLLHFDNNWSRLEDLLVRMLACRDQWLVYLGTGVDRQTAQAAVERSIEVVCRDTLTALDTSLAPWRNQLLGLWSYSRDNLGRATDLSWPGYTAADVTSWQGLAALMLTGEDKWRRQLTRREGFPAGKGEAAERKAEMLDLLATLAGENELLRLLRETRSLPESRPGDEHWEKVLSCTRLLPQLAARLAVVFQQHGVVDHTQVSLAALEALGEDENPTELALQLDYRLRHVLVDEFQDTAVNQFELVRRLTRGWAEHNQANPEDARTLFIVGDGMQSIYGFRDADVGLFIKAKQLGFDELELAPLALRTNFRSRAGLVEWVNRTFTGAFPAQDDIQRGEIAFSSAAAFDEQPGAVTLAAFPDQAAEAAWMADRVEGAMADGKCDSIAVLVRRKADLLALVPELKRRGLGWQAQEIDALGDSMVVRDLSSLCRALHNPVDRVAWLALLRAPWCGIDNRDLLTVANGAAGSSVCSLLLDCEPPQGLSEDGRRRIAATSTSLRDVSAYRERLGLRDWIEYAWLRLSGPGCVDDQGQLEDAEAFFTMLAQMETSGERYSPELLEEHIGKLFARSTASDSKLQLMTMHKAKGLEFDLVFIPNLSRGTRGESRDLLLWDEYHAADGEDCFMLAMDDESPHKQPSLYNYLYKQRKAKRRAESTRLLYVGATRAATELCLSASLEPNESGGWIPPSPGSLLAVIWETVAEEFVSPDTRSGEPEVPLDRNLLVRVAQPVVETRVAVVANADPNIPERREDTFASTVGTVIHQTLERLAGRELPALPIRKELEPWWRRELASVGAARLDEALARVAEDVENVLGDERGRWLLSPERQGAASELPVSCLLPDGRLAEYVIDLSYVEDNVRWVVDYKSSVPDSGQSLEEFVAAEEGRYRAQLENYRHLMTALEDKPVRCALYFTAVPHWHELTEK
jgi:ATP-dependent exoDNAse (exonuclease V) beta subunit